jgi:hypothetical protein
MPAIVFGEVNPVALVVGCDDDAHHVIGIITRADVFFVDA